MTDAIDVVGRAQGTANRGDLPADALEPGALTMFDDGGVVFTGNGVNSPADVCARIIALEAQHIPELVPFVGVPDAAVYVANNSLAQQNQHLKGQEADTAVPAGKQFYTSGGVDLKALLAPFKNNLDSLRQIVADANVGINSSSTTTGAGIYSKGLGLPVGGEPEGKPSPALNKR